MSLTLTSQLLAELDRESERTRRALQQVPDGKQDWKPHEKSMAFGYLAQLVATMPSWVALMIARDELDIAPPGGSKQPSAPMATRADLLAAADKAVSDARAALERTTDETLMTPWRLLAGGHVVAEAPRHVMIRDAINHLAHHRGQMTVYLRLMGATVPALYGPSADDKRFA